MAEADGKIVVGFEAKADATQAAAEGRRMAQAVQQGASSATMGARNLASGAEWGEKERRQEKARRAAQRQRLVDEILGEKQARAEEAWEKEQEQKAKKARQAKEREERLRNISSDALNRQRQRETTANFLREESLRQKTQYMLQEQRGMVPPKLSSIKGPGSFSLQGISALSASGIPYISTLARAMFSPLGAAAAGVSLELMLLKSVVRRMSEEYDAAAALYAKTLRSGGMSMSYVAGRSNLARILGVGEEDVLNYAQAVQAVGYKVEQATRLQVEYNGVMTAAAWEMRAARENMKSVWTVLSGEAAPAMQVFSSAVGNLAATLAYATKQEPLASIIRAGVTGFGGAGLAFANLFASPTGSAPGIGSNMSRTPASAWERMGLALGYGGGGPVYQTAQNTKRMSVTLEALRRTVDAHNALLTGLLQGIRFSGTLP